MTNHLAGANSPYLLQHAGNPVDWYPWGDEALGTARREDKPIFLSIGYAACHWCHVMEHESFEDPSTAAILNEHFISIKVDREERPDLDGIYMQATSAMTGSGGWPMSVFLTPDLRPFYAGTYFPPVARYNMPAFPELLLGLASAWKRNRDDIHRVAERVVEALWRSQQAPQAVRVDASVLDEAEAALASGADQEKGGWGRAPKFPQPMAIEYLLRRVAAGRSTQAGSLPTALRALRAMARGGMYDVVGGGFARYSTDDEWRVPHFEKMLYDNAQLSLAYVHAWLLTKDAYFSRIAGETLDFVVREMMDAEGGFYSSLDADSEGAEGKYYVWDQDEIREAIGDDDLSGLFETAYGITTRGNWEGSNILQRSLDDASLAARYRISAQEVARRLGVCHSLLLTRREQRLRPATDDKIIAAWNGLMLQAFSQAARFLVEPERKAAYAEVAMRSGRFILDSLHADGRLHRIWRRGQVGEQVFLEDHAAVILGLLDLYQLSFDDEWFAAALKLTDQMIAFFWDVQTGFFDTSASDRTLLLRPRDIQDNATPSGSALACEALLKIASLTGEGRYRDLAEKTLGLGPRDTGRFPTAFAKWLSAADRALAGDVQVALLYPPSSSVEPFLRVVDEEYRPDLVLAASPHPPGLQSPPLLQGRPLVDGMPTAYLCRNMLCKTPVADPQLLRQQF